MIQIPDIAPYLNQLKSEGCVVTSHQLFLGVFKNVTNNRIIETHHTVDFINADGAPRTVVVGIIRPDKYYCHVYQPEFNTLWEYIPGVELITRPL